MNKQKGIVILFAVLTIGLLVGVGVAMATLTQKQLILSNIGKQSQVAFYAADTGAECARYWDVVHDVFSLNDGNIDASAMTCAGFDDGDLLLEVHDVVGEVVPIDFTLPVSDEYFSVPYQYCAYVEIEKNVVTGETQIVSRGYNLPCSAPYSSRKVERAVRLSY